MHGPKQNLAASGRPLSGSSNMRAKKILAKGFALPQPLAKRELPMVNQNLLPKEGAMPGQNVLPKEVQFHANTSCQKRCQMCR
jgi:hypothetical protein